MSNWKAIQGRLSVFPATASAALPSALTLYQNLWGGDPEGFQGAPNPLLPSMAHGKRGTLGVNCIVLPGRVDVNLGPISPDTPSNSVPLIEDAEQFVSELRRLATVLSTALVKSTISRIATYVKFVSLEETNAAANKAVLKITPQRFQVGLEDEQEFVLQINQPRSSERFEGLQLNLITKWTVERYQILSFVVPMGGGPMPAQPQAPAPQSSEFIAASVAMDFNNVPVDKVLSHDEQSSLLLEGLTQTSQTMRECGLDIKGF